MNPGIWTEDKNFNEVTTLEQALWHLRLMRGSIRSCIESPSTAQYMSEEDKEIDRIQIQALDVAIKYLSFDCEGKFDKYIKGCQEMRKIMLEDENWESMKNLIEAVTYGGMALQKIQEEQEKEES